MTAKKQTLRKRKSPLETPRQRAPARKRINKRAKQLIVPNKNNDFRPFMQRTAGIIAVLLVVIVAQFVHTNFISGQVLGSNPAVTVERLLSDTNTQRSGYSAQPLTLSANLSAAASAKARDMLTNQYWSHDSPTGVTPWKWIADEGYSYIKAGENLARGFNSTSSIIAAWMNSPSHRENVLNPDYSEVGFAVVDGQFDGKHTTLIVALYAQPSAQAATILPPGTDGGMVLGQVEQEATFTERLARGLQSAAPPLIFSLTLLGIAFIVVSLAHKYRKKLPKEVRNTWYRHHALIKGVFIAIVALTAIFSYGSGLI